MNLQDNIDLPTYEDTSLEQSVEQPKINSEELEQNVEIVKKVDVCWEIFSRCLAIYQFKKELEK